jgi:hypothetical protein
MMDLDDELRRLLASDRLDVPVRPDAEHNIVTGARRVRRRRIATAATGGAVAVVAVVLTGVALASGQPDAVSAATNNPTTTSSSAVDTGSSVASSDESPPDTSAEDGQNDTPPVSDGSDDTETPGVDFPVLGPTGFRELELGQTVDEAQATGLLGDRDPVMGVGGGCDYHRLLMDGPGDFAGFVLVSDTVLYIDSNRMQTPEGIGPGSTVEQAKALYPDLDEEAAEKGSALVAVPGNDNAQYRLQFTDGEIARIALQEADQPCFLW